ncbi:MAG TPA: substrate-binding domain-containing protein [Candidatus Aquilonibacter sp.]|nr:substrate-binding domain-containing protein [Candidatus Aquilonibacter sp.]
MRALLVLLSLLLVGASAPQRDVLVVYAGSLVTPMEGPLATAAAADGLRLSGEPRGSTALAHLIEAHLRSPDVFISADRRLVDELATKGFVARSRTFASATLVLGYSPQSRFKALFEQAARGKISIKALLETPGLRIARTDPALDPKGARTIQALKLLGLPQTLGAIYPEEDLLVRLETGEADVAFLYSTESIARNIPSIALPGKASLSGEITYTLAILKAAAHPNAAARFATFIFSGPGRPILERAGLTYL